MSRLGLGAVFVRLLAAARAALPSIAIAAALMLVARGVSAEVAQSLVTLGVDLGRIRTLGDLQGGLEEAERILGYSVVRGAGSFEPA